MLPCSSLPRLVNTTSPTKEEEQQKDKSSIFTTQLKLILRDSPMGDLLGATLFKYFWFSFY